MLFRSHQEIGEMLNISDGTSKSQLSRAKRMLQEKLIQHNIRGVAHGE